MDEIVFRKHLRTYKILISVSMIALAISTVASAFFFMKWSESTDKYQKILSEKNTAAHDRDLMKISYDNLSNQITVMRDPAMHVLSMNALDSNQTYKAMVYYNGYTGEVYVDTGNLPQTPPDSQYQLWGMVKDRFINISPLNLDEIGIQKLRRLENISECGITMEHKTDSLPAEMHRFISLARVR
jgi:hypothetical protein